MRDFASCEFKSTIQPTHIELRCIHLGVDFVRTYGLSAKKKYPILVDAPEPAQTAGTLQDTNFIGGLAKLYHMYDLNVGDQVGLAFEDGTIIVVPPADRVRKITSKPSSAGTTEVPVRPTLEPGSELPPTVFTRQKLRHVHIPEFAPANLTGWTPETETDVFPVFGMLSENTEFRYCCGASQDLIEKLGYRAETKPDAILIDRATDDYLMAEFKVYSSDFTSNHHADDVDVLICLIDDEVDKSKLPGRVVPLKDLRERAVKEGDIPLDELS